MGIFDLAVIVLALGICPSIRFVAAADRPNVLFILADDMGQWAARSALPWIVHIRSAHALQALAVSYSHCRVEELQTVVVYDIVCYRLLFYSCQTISAQDLWQP